MSTTPSGLQFMRFGQLVVSNGTSGLNLSNLRFTFEVRASDVETPNTATIKIYNLAPATVKQIIGTPGVDNGFTTVTLTAGYVNGSKGNIFQGDIKQFRIGKERNVDSYLTIMAGDGDKAYNESIVNGSFPPGTNDSTQLSTIAGAMGLPVAAPADGFLTTGGILPRGKVMFGMARLYMRDLAHNNNCRWSIQNGVVTLVPNTGYLPGTAVAINAATGMIGTPEATDAGITVHCYLNPLIQIGQMVQINNADINQAVVKSQFFPSYTSQYYPANTTADGFYRVLVAEHVGDMRGNDFYTELTCLAIDKSASANNSVQSNG